MLHLRARGTNGSVLTMSIVDAYGNADAADSESICAVSPLSTTVADGSREQVGGVTAKPLASASAVALGGQAARVVRGVATLPSFAARGPIGSSHRVEVACTSAALKLAPFHRMLTILPCQAGGMLSLAGVCQLCTAGMYSPSGRACYDCPTGANCTVKVSPFESHGAVLPTNLPGFWHYLSTPSAVTLSLCGALADPRCSYNTAWEPRTSSCVKLTAAFGWSSDKVYACLSGFQFYRCPLGAPSCPANQPLPSKNGGLGGCGKGYEGPLCSSCKVGYHKTSSGVCVACVSVEGEMRSSRVVYTVLSALAFLLLLLGIAFYLMEDQSLAARRLLNFATFGGAYFWRRWRRSRRTRPLPVRRRPTNGLSDSQQRQQRQQQDQFLDEALRVTKFKILLLNFQLFHQFEVAKVIRWPPAVRAYMAGFSGTGMNWVELASVDCLFPADFFHKFTLTCLFPLAMLLLLAVLLLLGTASYSLKFRAFPRICLRCHGVMPRTTSIRPLSRLLHQSLSISVRVRTITRQATQAAAGHAPQQQEGGQVLAVHQPTCALPVSGSGPTAEQTVRQNLDHFRKRVFTRIFFTNYQNKTLKLFFWLLLLCYTPVSDSLLQLLRCTQVGRRYVLAADTRVPCAMGGRWGRYVLLGAIPANLLFLLGIPALFWFVLHRARSSGVQQAWGVVSHAKPGSGAARFKRKLLREVRAHREAHLKLWVPPASQAEERAVVVRYLRHRNMASPKTMAMLGFVYDTYREEAWWYELVELARRLVINALLRFAAPGTPMQIMCLMFVSLCFLSTHLWVRPYPHWDDRMLAALSHVQLLVTLFLGLLLQTASDIPWLSSLSNYRQMQQQFVTWVIILLHTSLLLFGTVSGLREKTALLRSWRRKQLRARRVRAAAAAATAAATAAADSTTTAQSAPATTSPQRGAEQLQPIVESGGGAGAGGATVVVASADAARLSTT